MSFTLSEPIKGIYTLVFDLPGEKVNKLSLATLEELEAIIDNLRAKALIIMSGKKDQFIAGADLKQFEPAFQDPALGKKLIELGQRVFSKLSQLPFPVIAAIHGPCLGGGCELALACSHRIATDSPKTLIGLPETTLGLIPGWGGTQRLPRLIGFRRGTEMILTGRPVTGAKAYKMGLVDDLAAPDFLLEKALSFAQKPHYAKIKRPLWEYNPIGRAYLYHRFKKEVLKSRYPAPLLALETIYKGYSKPLNEGLQIEMRAFAKLDTVIANQLIALFFGQEALKKSLGAGLEVKSVGLIGAGTMGGGIAWVFANKNLPTRIKDISWEAIGHATKTAWALFARKKTTNLFHNLSWTLDTTGFNKVDFIVETATEDLDLKRKIYAELEAKTEAIIATNTSSLTIADLSRDLKHPERFIGMHFFNPANRMPLVEIVPGPKTSPETLKTTFELVKKIGKIPLVVGDCHGFLVNRIFMAAARQALLLLQEGVTIPELDQAMLAWGMPMGSCQLMDEVGIDVTYKVAKTFETAYGERMRVPPLLPRLFEAHLLGKKSGRGFYTDKKLTPEAVEIVASFEGKNSFTPAQIEERILGAMRDEAQKCLDEGVVKSPQEIHLALVLGTGYPPFRKPLI